MGLIVQFKINNAESQYYQIIQNKNCYMISDPRFIPPGFTPWETNMSLHPGLEIYFVPIPRVYPSGIYTQGYEYNSLPGMRIFLRDVNTG